VDKHVLGGLLEKKLRRYSQITVGKKKKGNKGNLVQRNREVEKQLHGGEIMGPINQKAITETVYDLLWIHLQRPVGGGHWDGKTKKNSGKKGLGFKSVGVTEQKPNGADLGSSAG